MGPLQTTAAAATGTTTVPPFSRVTAEAVRRLDSHSKLTFLLYLGTIKSLI